MSGNVVIAGDAIVAGIDFEDAEEAGEIEHAIVIQFDSAKAMGEALRDRTVNFTVFEE